MKFRNGLMGAVLVMLTATVSAQSPTLYDDALLKVVGGDEVGLLGFGRGGSSAAALSSLQMDLAPSFEKMGDVTERVEFYDLWRVKVQDGVLPGIYSFKDVEINAIGTLLFDFVAFNSIDAAGELQTQKFVVTDGGTKAIGSGIFTVRTSCPISSCIYIQVSGTQAAGQMGYGDPDVISLIATPVPEPSAWALLVMGLTVVGGLARRRRP
jgi:hypothetical protein